MSSAYVIAHVEVSNPAQYEEYKRWSSEAIKVHGAEVCVRGGKVEVLEGDWHPQRIVVLKFPSMEAANRFYASPEYGKAREARAGAAIMRMIAVEGV
jgi:uncharacterized protein (DUF1330 family)